MTHLLNEMSGLIAFVRTVEVGSFSAAARDLKTSPSAISKSVGRLEKLVGSRLFLRSTRALTLTPDGQMLFERIGPLLRELDASDDGLSSSSGLTGRLRFSMPVEMSELFLGAIFTKFAEEYPDLTLDIGLTDRFVDIIRDDYDVVFRVGEVVQPDLVVRHLADLDMVLVAAPSLLSKWGVPRTIDDFQSMPFARYSVGSRTAHIAFADGSKILPTGRIDCDSGIALHSAAQHGLGVALLLRCVVADDLDSGILIDVTPAGALKPMRFSAVHALGRTVPSRVKLLSDFVALEAQKLSIRARSPGDAAAARD